MTYVIGKSFESSDGKVKLTFNTSQATLKAGSSSFNYMYDKFSYIGAGYKGLIEMTELSGEGGLKMYVSCKEKMMTDNAGTLLYEKGTIGNSSSSNSSVKIGNLEVMTKDLGEMEWDDAMKACAALGDGWRLPTKEEFNILYQNKDKIGGFDKNYYWSSAEYDDGSARYFYFGNGNASHSSKYTTYYVRAVRAF
jgi:hypothetical protein